MAKKYYEVCIDHDSAHPVCEYESIDEVYEQIEIYKEEDKKDGIKTIYTIYEVNNGESILYADYV